MEVPQETAQATVQALYQDSSPPEGCGGDSRAAAAVSSQRDAATQVSIGITSEKGVQTDLQVPRDTEVGVFNREFVGVEASMFVDKEEHEHTDLDIEAPTDEDTVMPGVGVPAQGEEPDLDITAPTDEATVGPGVKEVPKGEEADLDRDPHMQADEVTGHSYLKAGGPGHPQGERTQKNKDASCETERVKENRDLQRVLGVRRQVILRWLKETSTWSQSTADKVTELEEISAWLREFRGQERMLIDPPGGHGHPLGQGAPRGHRQGVQEAAVRPVPGPGVAGQWQPGWWGGPTAASPSGSAAGSRFEERCA